MSYCTIADLEETIDQKQLIDYSNDIDRAETADHDRLTSIINIVDHLIDDHLRGFIPLPISPPSDTLKEIAIRLCQYKLWEHRDALRITAGQKAHYDTYMSQLKKIQRGEIKIAEAPTVENRSSTLKVYSRPARFNDELLDRY